MYTQFFGLSRAPFQLTPDPAFFYQTPAHNEALANLCYGIQVRKGFIVLTGEVGTGKTLLVYHLMRWLATTPIQFAFLFAPRFTPVEFLQYTLTDLGVSAVFGHSKPELLWRLNRFLLEQRDRGSTTALIVDEAHLLDWKVLEEIRLLTNCETAEEKLLQILLIGQPELDGKLDSPHLRQLKQRVALRCQLVPMTEEQTAAYVEARLRRAGARGAIFSREAVRLVCRYSAGIPRLINTLCDSAMINAWAQQLRCVPPESVEEAAEDHRLRAGITVGPQMMPLLTSSSIGAGTDLQLYKKRQ